MTEQISSYGQVQTVKNGIKVHHKEYGLHYDGMNMDIAIKDAVNNKHIIGRLDKKDIMNLLTQKNEKVSLKDNLERLLPKKINERRKPKTKKRKKKKNNITFKIEEKTKKRKKKSRKRRKGKKKEQRLKDFFDFLN
jgi:hypothetical protein